MSLCDRMWFQILERCSRPASRWFFAVAAVAYAFRPVFDLSFSEGTFIALCAPVGLTYVSRGMEKIQEKKIEESLPFLGKGERP